MKAINPSPQFYCLNCMSCVYYGAEFTVRMMDLHHPHVLTLTGVCLDAGPAPYIVMPFMANGSLLEYIKMEKKNLVFPDHSMQDSEQVSADHC